MDTLSNNSSNSSLNNSSNSSLNNSLNDLSNGLLNNSSDKSLHPLSYITAGCFKGFIKQPISSLNIQLDYAINNNLNIKSHMVDYLKNGGLRSLFLGYHTTVLSTITLVGLRFSIYNHLSHQMNYHPLLAGIGAGFVNTLVKTPFSRLNKYIQLSTKPTYHTKVLNAYSIIRTQPLKGFQMNLLQEMVTNGIYFSVFHYIYTNREKLNLESELSYSFLQGIGCHWGVLYIAYPIQIMRDANKNNPINGARSIYKEHGVKGFLPGRTQIFGKGLYINLMMSGIINFMMMKFDDFTK
jgi:hypothetical protein